MNSAKHKKNIGEKKMEKDMLEENSRLKPLSSERRAYLDSLIREATASDKPLESAMPCAWDRKGGRGYDGDRNKPLFLRKWAI